MIRNLASALATSACMVALVTPAQAQTQTQTQTYNIPAGDLKDALDAYARQSGRQIIYKADEARGTASKGARGNLSPQVALDALLVGTGFSAKQDVSGAVAVYRLDAEGKGVRPNGSVDATRAEETEVDEIVVTGTRIRGAEAASPTIAITAAQVRQEGRTNLGEVIRDVPQNYRGGQNPGVLIGASGLANQNITGGSSLNLRGLGPDATLTLLNGRRLSYSGFVNAVDVLTVPIEALDRLEIVPDGASAIYGSDAVAGVANIIIKRDYDGFAATLRGGTTTDGGNREYQVSLTGGTTWQDGGFIAAYDRLDSNGVDVRDRSYLYDPAGVKGVLSPFSLFPALDSHSGLFSGHQRLGPNIEVSADGIYTTRRSVSRYLFPEAANDLETRTKTFAISPSLDVDLGANWTASLSGTYGTDKVKSRQSLTFKGQSRPSTSEVCYCNSTKAIELAVQGSLLELAGGSLKLAAGGGYRRNDFALRTILGSGASDVSGSRSSKFAYGELNVPLVSAAMGVAGIRRLTLSGALRHEDYGSIGAVTTPKLGAIYQPIEPLTIKGSWGRSFKAPTLSQQFTIGNGFLATAADFGSANLPPDAEVLFIGGGNQNLKPERAETWAMTASVRPVEVPSLEFEVTYFRVNYMDRVAEPFLDLFGALDNPIVAQFVNLSPTGPELQSAVDYAGSRLFNLTGGDPLRAVAVLDGRNVNLAVDRVRGVDVSGSYRFKLAGGDAAIRGSASWLEGRRQLFSGQPSEQTVGIVYNPAKFQARAGVVWEKGQFDTSVFFNHVGSVLATDTSGDPKRTDTFSTFDFTLRYRTEQARSALAGLEVAFVVNNLFNQRPPLLDATAPGRVNLDSTNYSPLGRSLSLSVTKRWESK